MGHNDTDDTHWLMLDDTMDAEDCHALPRREVELTANDDSVP